MRTVDVHSGLLHEFLDQLADGIIGAVGLVGLDHSELGGVGGVDALVAEVAVDLEHTVDAADQAALEEQFRGDAQVQIQVEGVHVRGERTGGRATVQGLQHRGFDLEEVVGIEGVTQGCHGLGTVAHHVANVLVRDHADVRLAGAGVFVQILVQGRQRLQSLGCDGPFGGEYGQLTGLGSDDATLQVQMIAKVNELLELLQGVGSDLLLGDHALNLGAVAGGQLHEAQATSVAQEQHAAGDADHVFGLLASFELAVVLGAYLFDGVGHIKVHRVGGNAGLKHHRALGHTHLHLLGVAQRAELLVGRIHGLVQRGAGLDLLTDSGILLEQHFRTLNSAHLRDCRGFVLSIFSVLNNFSHGSSVYAKPTIKNDMPSCFVQHHNVISTTVAKTGCSAAW